MWTQWSRSGDRGATVTVRDTNRPHEVDREPPDQPPKPHIRGVKSGSYPRVLPLPMEEIEAGTEGDDAPLETMPSMPEIKEPRATAAAQAETSESVSTGRHQTYPPGYVLDGRYEIVRKLGHGRLGRVYAAQDVASGMVVVVKYLATEILGHEGARERIAKEAALLAELDCPQVIGMRAAALDHAPPYLVLEYVDGASVEQILESRGRIGPWPAMQIALEVVRGLGAAMDQGIVHRDVTPRNILISRDGQVKLSDFGLAMHRYGRSMPEARTRSNVVEGTPLYMAPELWRGEPPDCRADMYALGITLYRMVVGEHPFDGDTVASVMFQHLETPLPGAKAWKAGMPLELVRLVQRLTAKSRDDRPGTYHEIERELTSILGPQWSQEVRVELLGGQGPAP